MLLLAVLAIIATLLATVHVADTIERRHRERVLRRRFLDRVVSPQRDAGWFR